MHYRDVLVQSKSDVDKLIRYADEQLQELVSLHEQYGDMTRRWSRDSRTR